MSHQLAYVRHVNWYPSERQHLLCSGSDYRRGAAWPT